MFFPQPWAEISTLSNSSSCLLIRIRYRAFDSNTVLTVSENLYLKSSAENVALNPAESFQLLIEKIGFSHIFKSC
ncbi:hypothetical protein BCT69_21050 [Enterovibrio norvegicus]|nr:hypothetical protein BCT69_21050 [Enterovibrio norvegicus]